MIAMHLEYYNSMSFRLAEQSCSRFLLKICFEHTASINQISNKFEIVQIAEATIYPVQKKSSDYSRSSTGRLQMRNKIC